MSPNISRFVISNVITILTSLFSILIIVLTYLKNPFRNPWARKLRLVPPGALSDPKYGVHKYIKVNHIKLHYVESGNPSKPLMLFVHGFPDFWYSWRRQIVEFNKDYWCVAVDMRGYGDSERPEGLDHYKIELLVEDLRDLIRQLGVEKCILVSHDWGGIISARFRDVYPEVTSACILLASITRETWFHQMWNTNKQMLKSWYVFFFRTPYLPEQLLLMDDMAMFNSSMIVKGKTEVDENDLECYKYWFGKPSALTGPINYYRANFAYEFPEKYQKEDVPFLVAQGRNDSFIDHSTLDIIKKEYATVETTIVEDVGHFMQQEEPVRVNKIIRDFLTKHNL